ncbi:MAG: transglycosylase domain-containing protein [Bacteroidota bacterium]
MRVNIASLGWTLGLAAVLGTAWLVHHIHPIPDAGSLGAEGGAALPVASVVLAADGTEVARFFRQKRRWVDRADIAPSVVEALLATEDHRFYAHQGVDGRRLVGALVGTARGTRQGGSTLTMQLVRNRVPDVARASLIRRKLLEVILAWRRERQHTKDEILLHYLNTVPFGQRAYGIEAAAEAFFGTTASALTVGQSATLVALLRGPSYYNPVRYPDRARARRNLVLRQMAARGRLSATEATTLAAAPLGLRPTPYDPATQLAPYAAVHLRREAEAWAEAQGYDLYADGLRLYTTLDPALQQAAERFLADHVARLEASAPQADAEAYLDAGLVALEPHTGRIRVWVGGRDFARQQYDKVAQARRQPGSTFKTFVYAAALDAGYAPADTLEAGRRVFRTEAGPAWAPRTASRTEAEAPVYHSLREALAQSDNAAAAALAVEVAPWRVAAMAQRLGIESPLDAVPALALGSSAVTLLELTTAYAALADGGQRRMPRLLAAIDDRHGQRLATFTSPPTAALASHTAYTVVDMLRTAVDEGTGRAVRDWVGPAADVIGKTGTTQRYADGWFVAAHPRLVAGAWVGFTDARIAFETPQGEGRRTALPLVGHVLREALATGQIRADTRFEPPPGYRMAQPRSADFLEVRATPPGPADPPETLAADSALARPDLFQLLPRDSVGLEAAPLDAEAALRRALDADPPGRQRP